MDVEFKTKLKKSGIDVDGAIKRFSGNVEIYEKYLRTFPEDEAFSNLIEAYVAGDYVKLQKAAHTLKGTSSNFGIGFITQPCTQLSNELKANEYSNIDTLVADINAALAKLSDVLE